MCICAAGRVCLPLKEGVVCLLLFVVNYTVRRFCRLRTTIRYDTICDKNSIEWLADVQEFDRWDSIDVRKAISVSK